MNYTRSFARWSYLSFIKKRLSVRRGLYHSVRLVQSQLYSAHALTKPGEKNAHRWVGEVLLDLPEQGVVAELCSQMVPDTNLWNSGQGSSTFPTGCGGLWSEEPPHLAPQEHLHSQESGMAMVRQICRAPFSSKCKTFSEHRAEHTATIPKDWPTALIRSLTAECSEQLRFKKNK